MWLTPQYLAIPGLRHVMLLDSTPFIMCVCVCLHPSGFILKYKCLLAKENGIEELLLDQSFDET